MRFVKLRFARVGVCALVGQAFNLSGLDSRTAGNVE
jgi:hypothetical protein